MPNRKEWIVAARCGWIKESLALSLAQFFRRMHTFQPGDVTGSDSLPATVYRTASSPLGDTRRSGQQRAFTEGRNPRLSFGPGATLRDNFWRKIT